MSLTGTILIMAAATFACRSLGLLGLPVRNAWTARAMRLVPVAVFAGLVSGGLEVRPGAWLRWCAVGAGGFVSWKGAPIWLSVGLGLAVYLAGAGLLRVPLR